ncbi:MAG: GMC family oxidoreductase [Thermodesulfobacteriota bacterium]|nr:GMC family oxidoreductase [Thermodesulfobacteriota bacterium]
MSNYNFYDYIIIGSGFGGSVSALRLAEKGYSVIILEKGKRYETEDFPKTNWNIRKSLWIPQFGLYGIWGLSLLRHVFILHGTGVGGGSLNYCNQLLIPPDDVFERDEWGTGNWNSKLAPFYKTARQMLGANPCPRIGKADEVLAEIGREIRGEDTFHINDVGVFFGEPGKKTADPYFNGEGPDRTGCNFCGACMIGCPIGSKNTLDKNYLYLAENKYEVKIIPEMEATGVYPINNGYKVFAKKSTGLYHHKKTYIAKGVIFSGGVMGSVKLLLKCKKNGLLPNLSKQLGNLIRTNSEAILGVKANDRHADYSDQISITSGIYPDKNTHVEIVRFNKGSDLMASLTTLLTDGGGHIPRFLRFLVNSFSHPLAFLKTLWFPGWGARTSILLVMQKEENYMRFDYKRRWWRLGKQSLNSEIAPETKKVPSYIPIANEIAKRMGEKIDGQPLSSWPEVLFDVPTTAHILGGAVMGSTNEDGVVNFKGEIHDYPNLYVVDGSNVPVNLGVNPSLTITALAEYIMSQIPRKA